MGRDVLSVRQIMVVLLVALLATATDVLPGVAAQQVGRGGWLMMLGALPTLLLASWVCSKLFCGRDLWVIAGKPLGYTIIIVYMIWILMTLTVVLRLSAGRMELIYSKVPPIFFAAFVAVAAGWMGIGKVSALARAAEIFYLALTVVLAGVLLLASFKVEWCNLYPVEWNKLPAGSLSAVGILLNVVPAAVLAARVPPAARSTRNVCGWVVAFCVATTGVLAAIWGNIGSVLTAQLDIPYLIMVQGLGVKGAFQRTEALVAAMWLLSDVVLAGVLLLSWREYTVKLSNEKWGKWSVSAAAAAAVAAGWLLFSDENSVQVFCREVLSPAGIVLGLIIPLLFLLITRVRKRNRG